MSDYLALAERLEDNARLPIPSVFACRDAAQALREAHAERESFHMDYRMKCDEQTKEAHAEVERLRALLPVARAALQKTMCVWGGTCAWHNDVADAIARIDRELGEKP